MSNALITRSGSGSEEKAQPTTRQVLLRRDFGGMAYAALKARLRQSHYCRLEVTLLA